MGVKRVDQIAIVAFDFDGVFTDNKVISDSDGVEYVVCSRADSYGISMLHKEISDRCLKTRTMVVTTEANSVVKKRCKKMGIMCHDNVSDKKSFMQSEIDKIRSSGIVAISYLSAMILMIKKYAFVDLSLVQPMLTRRSRKYLPTFLLLLVGTGSFEKW